MFCVWNSRGEIWKKKNNWEHDEFDEGKSDFLLFFVISEMEVWRFSKASSSRNGSEMQH